MSSLLRTSTPECVKNRLSHSSNNNFLQTASTASKWALSGSNQQQQSYMSSQSPYSQGYDGVFGTSGRDLNQKYFSSSSSSANATPTNNIIGGNTSTTKDRQQYMNNQQPQQQQQQYQNVYVSSFLPQQNKQQNQFAVPQFGQPNRNNNNNNFNDFNSNYEDKMEIEGDRQQLKSLSTVLNGNFEPIILNRFSGKMPSNSSKLQQFMNNNAKHFSNQKSNATATNVPTSNMRITDTLKSVEQRVGQDLKKLGELKAQGFLENVVEKGMIQEGQQLIQSRQFLLNILIAITVFAISYILYRLNCALFGTKLSSGSETKAIIFLLLSLATKVFSFSNKIEISLNFYAWLFLGFAVDCLATHYYLAEIINVFFTNHVHLSGRLQVSQSLCTSLGIICTYIFFTKGRFVEDNRVQNINSKYATIIKASIQEQKTHFRRNIMISLLSVIVAVLICIISGGSIPSGKTAQNSSQQLFTSSSPSSVRSIYTIFGCDQNKSQLCSVPKAVVWMYLFALAQVLLFSLVTSLIINLKSNLVWNFLSQMNKVYQVPLYYFVMADKDANYPFLELKTMKFWQANYTNPKRINIRQTIAPDGVQIQMWEVLLNHGKSLKDRLFDAKMKFYDDLEKSYKIRNSTPESMLSWVFYTAKNIKTLIVGAAAEKELIFLLEKVIYSVQTLTDTLVAFKGANEYREIFEQNYSTTHLQDYQLSVFQSMVELKAVLPHHRQFSIIFKQLLNKMVLLMEIEGNRATLFNATIRGILNKPESFYNE